MHVRFVPAPRVVAAVAIVAMSMAIGSTTRIAPVRVVHAAGCPWMNAAQTPDQRAHELLAAMSLSDKIALLHGDGSGPQGYGAAGNIPGNSALCIPDLYLNDAGQGIGDFQINTTAYPAPIAQSSTWDPTLQNAVGQAIGGEAHAKGVNIWLAPDVNIARVPMNGRNFEAFGEDPYLTGQVAAAEISGAQSQHVIATVKHYAENNQETNRNTVSSDADERTMHEIELPGFEAAVKQGHTGAVMCAYNLVNSIYSCENPTILTSILKKEFGFNGFVMSDWGATHSTVPAANAGLDMEMPDGTYFGTPLQTAVEAGQVSMARLNDMVLRVLRSMFRIGVFDDPAAAEPEAYAANAETPDTTALARQASENGTVLLKNAGSILPLNGTGKRIAVIGTIAGPAGVQETYNGGGSAHIPEFGSKADVVSPLQGIEQRAASSLDAVTYADGSSMADAVAAATAADVAIVFAGQEDSEGVDRSSLQLQNSDCTFVGCETLPVDENQLIAQVAAANPNTIVVLNTGGPVLMPWIGQIKGLFEAWYPGQEDGNAIAALLFGDVNPSAKLPETFPKSQSDLPTQTAQQYPGVNLHAVYSEGLDVGYRWYDAKGIQPLFPFGFGLSYTTFKYSGLTITRGSGNNATVSFSITNAGSRSGAEIAQVYVGDPSTAGEPPKQLKGFQKVSLAPGETRQVTMTLGPRSFAYWSVSNHGWVIAPGTYRILVGASSRDIRLSGTMTAAAQVVGP